MARSDENEGRTDEREGITESASDDVEAHGITERPIESPIERTDEGDDVEAHILGDSPVAENMSDRPIENMSDSPID